jgi:DNA-binding MarR family transcriptional regulator
MSIDRPGSGLEGRSGPAEWCVPVCVSVAEHVPSAILRTWIVVETFARGQAACWPSNKALAARLGVKPRAAQRAVDVLEDHGIAQRRPMPGNRRSIVLIRRTSQPMAAVEWRALADRAERLATGRVALAAARKAERKVHRPKIRIVS